MRRDGGVSEERHLASWREETDVDVVFRRVRIEHERDVHVTHFAGDVPHLVLGEDVRVEHHGGGIAAEAFTRKGVDEVQAALTALGHSWGPEKNGA